MDDFFLHFLQKEHTKVEFHRAIGTEYTTLAVGYLKFNDLLSKSQGRIHGAARLVGNICILMYFVLILCICFATIGFR